MASYLVDYRSTPFERPAGPTFLPDVGQWGTGSLQRLGLVRWFPLALGMSDLRDLAGTAAIVQTGSPGSRGWPYYGLVPYFSSASGQYFTMGTATGVTTSISAWAVSFIYMTTTNSSSGGGGGLRDVISDENGGDSATFQIRYDPPNSRLNCTMRNSDLTTVTLNTTFNPVINRFYNLLMVYGTTCNLYVDGVLNATAAGTGTSRAATGASIVVGSSIFDSALRQTQGVITNIKFYRGRAITALDARNWHTPRERWEQERGPMSRAFVFLPAPVPTQYMQQALRPAIFKPGRAR